MTVTAVGAQPTTTPRTLARALARTLAGGAVCGALAGFVVGGVLGRLAMRLLAATSPAYAQGAITDDQATWPTASADWMGASSCQTSCSAEASRKGTARRAC